MLPRWPAEAPLLVGAGVLLRGRNRGCRHDFLLSNGLYNNKTIVIFANPMLSGVCEFLIISSAYTACGVEDPNLLK